MIPSAASLTEMPSGSAIFRRMLSRAACDVERHLAAEKAFGDHAPERDVGIGDRRFRAALTVGDGARMAAGAARPDFQRADLIDPGDAAAARADLDDVDDRQHHRMPARDAADEVALRDIGFAVLHEADFGGRAAHVERDHVGIAEPAADFGRGDDAADRARFHHRNRNALRGCRRHRAAVRLHDQEASAEGKRFEQTFEIGEILADARPDVGVQHGRRGAFVLAVFAQDVVRERAVHARREIGEDLADGNFVIRVRPRVQKADGHRLDIFGIQALGERARAVAFEYGDDVARRVEAFDDFVGVAARHVGRRAFEEEVVGFGPVAAPDAVDVARAFGDDQRRARPGTFDRGVDRDGRTVNERFRILHRQAALRKRLADADGEVVRSRGALGVMNRAVRQIERDQIGECTADIECNDQRQRSSPHGRQKGSIFLLVSPKGASRIPLARGLQT